MNGVGTQLHRIFQWWGFTPTGDCRCETRRKHYDQMGPQWCQEHIDEIVTEILEEADNRKKDFAAVLQNLLPTLSLSLPRPVQKLALKRIVQVCINRTLKSQ